MMFLLLLLPTAVHSHGRLTVPKTRLQDRLGYDTYENDPIGFQGRPMSQFVCRNDPVAGSSRTQVTAGQPMDMQWVNSALHVGDCAVYVGYGDAIVNGVGDAKNSGKFVKIANIYDCKRYSGQTIEIDLPSWLPAGPAVIRWEWYALHVAPTIEFYAQCSDVEITSASTLTAADLPSYPVYPWVLPENGNQGVGFRSAYDMSQPQFITGTPCAFPGDATARSGCELTAAGTQGHIAVGLGPDHAGEGGVAPPTPTPAPVVSVTPNPTASPIPAPTPAPTADAAPKPSPKPTGTPAPVAPSPSPAPETPAPTVAETESPTEDDNGTCGNAVWAKCDGKDSTTGAAFSGEKCCPAGSYCNYQTEWYSQCVPNESCSKQPYDQCAGPTFWESNCCPAGHYCKQMSDDGYSQCAPKQ